MNRLLWVTAPFLRNQGPGAMPNPTGARGKRKPGNADTASLFLNFDIMFIIDFFALILILKYHMKNTFF